MSNKFCRTLPLDLEPPLTDEDGLGLGAGDGLPLDGVAGFGEEATILGLNVSCDLNTSEGSLSAVNGVVGLGGGLFTTGAAAGVGGGVRGEPREGLGCLRAELGARWDARVGAGCLGVGGREGAVRKSLFLSWFAAGLATRLDDSRAGVKLKRLALSSRLLILAPLTPP